MKVLITGSTGFIGSHITELFVEEKEEVICLVRKSSNLSYIKDLNIRLKFGDITNLESLISAFNDVDYVIHVAAYVRDWGDYEKFKQINIDGTLNVLHACKKMNIKNIIITSTNSVYGEHNYPLAKDENSPTKSHYSYFCDRIFPCKLNYYRDTKAEARNKAIEFAQVNNLNLTIIEPVWVYGEREFHGGFYEYLKTAKSIPFMPGSRKNKFHVVYVKDLAKAYFLVFKKRLSGVNVFIIGNEKADYMHKTYSLFCKKAKIKIPINVPKFIVYPLGFLLEFMYTLLKISKPPILTRGRVNMFYDNIEYSTDKAKKLLGFTNSFTLEEGISRTVKWYKENGYI